MTDKPTTDLLGALPRTRPHRRSGKRSERPAEGAPAETPEAPAPEAETARTPAAGSATAGTPAPKRAARPPATKKPASTPRAKPRPVNGAGATARRRPQAVRETGTRTRLRQPPQPAGTPSRPRSRKPVPASGGEILGTAVQAAAELAEIGLSVSARALRNAVQRLPRP
jgi:hypothetical protein